MTLKLVILALIQYEMILITSPSIVGVTYRDDFDFEERYRDVNECNPFYWHPLHLPDYCAHMFEKLIRSRLAKQTPIRVMTERENEKKIKDAVYSLDKRTKFVYQPENHYQFPYPIYEMSSLEYESYGPTSHRHGKRQKGEGSRHGHSHGHSHGISFDNPYGEPLTPYEELLRLLKEDIKNGPSAPTVTVMPNLGPVALYNQAISKKSMNFIKQMAEAYVKETKKMYDQYYAAYGKYPSDPQLFVYDSAKNNTKTAENKRKKEKKEKNKKGKNDKNKVYKLKTKHGGVVTIIETMNPELLKKEPFEQHVK